MYYCILYSFTQYHFTVFNIYFRSETPSNRSYPVISIEYQQSRKLIVKSHSLKNVNDLLIVMQEETVKERGLRNENDTIYQKHLKLKVNH